MSQLRSDVAIRSRFLNTTAPNGYVPSLCDLIPHTFVLLRCIGFAL